MRRFFSTLLLASVASCVSVESSNGSTGAGIYGGDSPSQPYHGAVVALHSRSRRGVSRSPFCSGTFIGAQWILTAAHCVVDRNRVTAASALAVYVGNNPAVDLASHLYLVDQVRAHPSYNGTTMRNDIALLHVTAAITEAAPVAYLPSSLALAPADIGANLNHAGFGYDEQRDFGVKLQVDVPLGGFGCSVPGCSSAGDAATQISYVQAPSSAYPLGVGPCNGDSGGPAFVLRSGVAYVAGVTSYGDELCRVYGVSTRVDAFGAWIRSNTGL